jgi:CRISPR system Cascade subunit CasA
MSRFNLIDEKWIPVRYPNGERDELGIRDTLLQAKEISTIEDGSPLVVAALHRFLLAVLYRALEGPTDIDQAKVLFRDGLPGERISAYLEKWKERFWLFDDKFPFGQNPNVPQGELEPWTKLTAEFNASSNKVLFDHTDTKSPGGKRPNDCARWLLTGMNFSISGGRGYYPSPSPNAIMCIPLGRCLAETLIYNLIPYSNREVMKADIAQWEREPELLPLATPKRILSGFADTYTWQSRFVCLEEAEVGSVEKMRFIAGYGFENPTKILDPMQPYRSDPKLGLLPIRFKEGRGTWRDFDALLPDVDGLAPMTLQHSLRLAGRSAEAIPRALLILGLKYEPPSANVDFWRMERFALPGALAGNNSIRAHIRQLLAEAEDVEKSLWAACASFARDLLRRGESEPAKADISKFVKQMAVTDWYWSVLESCFHEMLSDFTLDRDPEDIHWQWLKSVRDTLKKAWERHHASVSMGDAWAIRALVKAESAVFRKLKKLDEEILKLEPKQEAA